jgi:hypothetical protein
MGVDVDGKESDARGEQGEECWTVEAGTGRGGRERRRWDDQKRMTCEK